MELAKNVKTHFAITEKILIISAPSALASTPPGLVPRRYLQAQVLETYHDEGKEGSHALRRMSGCKGIPLCQEGSALRMRTPPDPFLELLHVDELVAPKFGPGVSDLARRGLATPTPSATIQIRPTAPPFRPRPFFQDSGKPITLRSTRGICTASPNLTCVTMNAGPCVIKSVQTASLCAHGGWSHSAPPERGARHSEGTRLVHVSILLPHAAATRICQSWELMGTNRWASFTSILKVNFSPSICAWSVSTLVASRAASALGWSLTLTPLLTSTLCVPSKNNLTVKSPASAIPDYTTAPRKSYHEAVCLAVLH